jgi:hypothetical protein
MSVALSRNPTVEFNVGELRAQIGILDQEQDCGNKHQIGIPKL